MRCIVLSTCERVASRIVFWAIFSSMCLGNGVCVPTLLLSFDSVSGSWHFCLLCFFFSVKAHALHLCLFACHVVFCLVVVFGGSTWLLLCLYFYVLCAPPSNFCKRPLVISLLVNLPHLLYFITLLISFPIYFSCVLCPVLVHFFSFLFCFSFLNNYLCS